MTGGAGRPRSGHRLSAFALVLAAPALVACALPRVEVDVAGQIQVLDPPPLLGTGGIGDDWVIEGPSMGLSGAVVAGVPAIRMAAGQTGFAFVRRTRALLLATPFLSWSWRLDGTGGRLHPVRVHVGFHGGDPASGSPGGTPFAWLGTALPPHDRLLAVGWGDSALRRGSFDVAGGDGRAVARYTVRGGRENLGRWWQESVDLSALYERAWPGDRMERVTVVFIGFDVAGGSDSEGESGLVANLVLSR